MNAAARPPAGHAQDARERPDGGPVNWLRHDADGSLSFLLHIQPGAKRTGIAGLHGDALKIRLAAPPVEGRANAALIAFFADMLEVPKAAVSLEAGAASRRKRIRVSGASPEAVAALTAAVARAGEA